MARVMCLLVGRTSDVSSPRYLVMTSLNKYYGIQTGYLRSLHSFTGKFCHLSNALPKKKIHFPGVLALYVFLALRIFHKLHTQPITWQLASKFVYKEHI